MNEPDCRSLGALSEFLARERSSILEAWRAAAQQDAQLKAGSTLSKTQFYDHIPEILDGLQQRLRDPSAGHDHAAREREAATQHGAQRWRQGYGQRDLMREWRHLHLILVDRIEQFAAARPPADQPALALARRILADLVNDVIADSVEQFAELQRADAAGRTQALEHALAELGTIETQRAAIWHQAAHDLRGSLSVVRNVGEMLTLPSDRNGDPARPLLVLQRAVGSMHALLNDLLNLARLEAGHEQLSLSTFDAALLLGELCEGMLPAARARGLTLTTSGPATLEVQGDRVKTHRIAHNLLNNAIQYTESGGVHLNWHADPQAPDERWLLVVQDTGPGMPQQTGAPAQGTRHAGGEGIGLSIVRRMCELLQVRHEVRNLPGAGTAFNLWFPRRYSDDEAPPAS